MSKEKETVAVCVRVSTWGRRECAALETQAVEGGLRHVGNRNGQQGSRQKNRVGRDWTLVRRTGIN